MVLSLAKSCFTICQTKLPPPPPNAVAAPSVVQAAHRTPYFFRCAVASLSKRPVHKALFTNILTVHCVKGLKPLGQYADAGHCQPNRQLVNKSLSHMTVEVVCVCVCLWAQQQQLSTNLLSTVGCFILHRCFHLWPHQTLRRLSGWIVSGKVSVLSPCGSFLE